jgi:hypothetical protein
LSVANPSFAKESIIADIEDKSLQLFQSESGSNYAKLISKSINNNKHNILLIQQRNGDKFSCYELPKISINNLLNGFSGNAFPDITSFECSGGI